MANTSTQDMEWLKSNVEKLTKKQVEEFREAFNLYDADQDGQITSKELKSAMVSLGQDPTDEQVEEMIAKVDLDGNGSLEFDEFLVMMAAKIFAEEDGKVAIGGNWAAKVPIPYVWDSSFATLYNRIDDEHKTLFHAIWDCYENRDSSYKLLHMVATMQMHFTYEEGCMKASKHEGYVRHKEVHDAYMEKLKHFSTPITDKEIKFCMSWLVQHIINTDFKYKGKLLFNEGDELLSC